jgi:hypothetical protein
MTRYGDEKMPKSYKRGSSLTASPKLSARNCLLAEPGGGFWQGPDKSTLKGLS